MREDEDSTAGQLWENYLCTRNSLCIARVCVSVAIHALFIQLFRSIGFLFRFVPCLPCNIVQFCTFVYASFLRFVFVSFPLTCVALSSVFNANET